jgi:hypothetical protein
MKLSFAAGPKLTDDLGSLPTHASRAGAVVGSARQRQRAQVRRRRVLAKARARPVSDPSSGVALCAGLALCATGLTLGTSVHGAEQSIAFAVAAAGCYASAVACFGLLVPAAARRTARIALALIGITMVVGASAELLAAAYAATERTRPRLAHAGSARRTQREEPVEARSQSQTG